jgi:hypothetical protein
VLVCTLIPIGVFMFVPAVLFRTHLKRHRSAWIRRGSHVVHGAYRGSVVETLAPARVPISVALGSLMSLYIAIPVLVVGPYALGSALAGSPGEAIGGTACSLLMIASAIVGCAILRPSREAARGAFVVGAVELVIALGAAYSEWTPLAVATGTHGVVLLLAALSNERANVARCA